MSTTTQTSGVRAPIDRRQVGIITVAAVAVFFGIRYLPTGTNLSHMDFRVDAKNAIEFCDPLNPQFIPVVAARSPVALKLTTSGATTVGVEQHCELVLDTASGKPIAPEDLLISHTRKLHLLIVDPTLTDYQHVHPEPGRTKGQWEFSFTPRLPGTYRVFADFTPAATARSLYANTDVEVAPPPTGGEASLPVKVANGSTLAPAAASVATAKTTAFVVERDGYRYELTPTTLPVRANRPTDLNFAITRADGARVPMEPVMGAFAHLVAFDEPRSGFAHLHPTQIDLTQPPDALHPVLNFKITIPKSGRYVIWAQINLGGQETFVPFWFDVTE